MEWANLTQVNIGARIPYKKWSSPHTQEKSPKFSTLMQSQKGHNDFCSFQSKSFTITVIQVYAPASNVEEAEIEWFYEYLQEHLEITTTTTTTKKEMLF